MIINKEILGTTNKNTYTAKNAQTSWLDSTG